jgi:threonine dehydrogenase-like Zn-dependent dehydrogenase
MKALVYDGPRKVHVKEVPDPQLKAPTDALIRITSTNICGSDLHMYEGRTSVEKGKVLGHENLGEVVEVGDAVVRVKVGDRVCLPFNIACGFCRNCEKGQTGFCLTTNPGNAGAAYGYAEMGPYDGGQAEFLRVPFADFNCLRLPEDAVEKEDDYVMLSDIFPTGWHATRLAQLMPGESVVIYGAGPVGLMAAYSAVLQGARQIMVVDRHPDRLALAEKIGAIAIDDSKEDPSERVMELTKGLGADKGCECVGWQAHDPQAAERHHEQAGRLGARDGCDRRGGGVRARRSEEPGHVDEGRADRVRLREVLLEGPAHGQRSGQREGVQPRAARSDSCGQGDALVPHLAPPRAGRGARGVQPLRSARPRVDQGRAQAGGVITPRSR